MGWAKRVGLYLFVNLLVIVTISLVLNILNIRPYLNRSGLNYEALMAFCLIWGMGGALISLALSKFMAKMMMGIKIIPPNSPDQSCRELLNKVQQLSRKAGLRAVPEVGIYDSPEVNAFATGPTQSHALVAVSTGLLQKMESDEVEGVLAHEVAHIANGDMVTMTLLQGIVNAFVMFLARVIAFVVMRGGRDEEESHGVGGFGYYILVFFLEMILMALGSLVVMAFSRFREYRADAGGAMLAGKEKMIAALERLENTHSIRDSHAEQAAVQALKISDGRSRFFALFASHPPLKERIRRLREGL